MCKLPKKKIPYFPTNTERARSGTTSIADVRCDGSHLATVVIVGRAVGQVVYFIGRPMKIETVGGGGGGFQNGLSPRRSAPRGNFNGTSTRFVLYDMWLNDIQ